MERIIIIGCPGSGKSTFARRLRDVTRLPLYYLDLIWHNADRTTVSKDFFDKQLIQIMENPRWIIDGNFCRTLEMRLEKCDTVFLLDYDLDVCLLGVESRIGKKREDMPWIEEEFDKDFKEYIMGFKSDRLPSIYESLKKYQKKVKVYIFKNRDETEEFLDNYEKTLLD